MHITHKLIFISCFTGSLCACGESAQSNSSYEGDASWSAGAVAAGGDSVDEPEAPQEVVPAGQLTAGRWDDHAHWDFWMKLVDEPGTWRKELEPWGMLPTQRVVVTLESPEGIARDMPVELLSEEGEVLWRARSDHKGVAVLFPSLLLGAPAPPKAMRVHVDGQSTLVDMQETSAYTIELPRHTIPEPVLDVMFMIDVTSSMLDEQEYLRAELKDVMTRVKAEREGVRIRLSMSFYCDPDDVFSVQSSEFKSVEQGLALLEQGASCGGGDYEEGVDEGLEEALKQDWSTSARARLLFLVLDAPPHQDQEGVARLQNFAREASSRGVRLVPVVASGSNKPLEFLLRALVLSTQGLYVFLTNDSGIGDDKIEPTIGSYEVEMLNELLLDVLLTHSALP